MQKMADKNQDIYKCWYEAEADKPGDEHDDEYEVEISSKPTNYTKIIAFKNLDMDKLEREVDIEQREYTTELIDKFIDDDKQRETMFSNDRMDKNLIKFICKLAEIKGLYPVKKTSTLEGMVFHNLVLYKTKEEAAELGELH